MKKVTPHPLSTKYIISPTALFNLFTDLPKNVTINYKEYEKPKILYYLLVAIYSNELIDTFF